MNETEKLRVLLPHWIEHNQEHATEFREWAERLRQSGYEETAQSIKVAADHLDEATPPCLRPWRSWVDRWNTTITTSIEQRD